MLLRGQNDAWALGFRLVWVDWSAGVGMGLEWGFGRQH